MYIWKGKSIIFLSYNQRFTRQIYVDFHHSLLLVNIELKKN